MAGARSIMRAAKARVAKLAPGSRLHQSVAAGPLEGMVFLLPTGWEAHYTRGDYEPDVAAALTRLVSPGDTCVDAGAHYGYFTLLLAKLCGRSGHVYSFEASAENARVLEENVRANDVETYVTVERAAVSAREGTVELHGVPSGSSSEWTLDEAFATRPARAGGSRRSEQARAVRLDRYLDGVSRVDLIKMDIEGAEAEVVPALPEFLEHHRPTILLEFHREVGWPAIEALLASGYELESLDGTGLTSPQTADDVPYQLVARRARG